MLAQQNFVAGVIEKIFFYKIAELHINIWLTDSSFTASKEFFDKFPNNACLTIRLH